MSTTLFGITFLSWSSWKYLFLLLACLALFGWQTQKRLRVISLLVGDHKNLLSNFSWAKQIIKVVLFGLGLLFLWLVFLRPGWGKKEQVIEQEGRDLFIALDVSRSMLAQDLKPNRLEFAKKKIKRLLQKLECERVGLLIFSGSTIVQCPLTTDYGAFFMFLDQLDAETISSGTTALDQAIKRVLEVFRSMPSKKHKLLVLLTDGEDFSSNLTGIKADALKEGLTLFTLGLGTPEGAPIPLINKHGESEGHQRDQKGTIVISRLNEGLLRALADQSGGMYLRVQDNDQDLDQLVAKVQEFEREKFEDKNIIDIQERYPYAAGGALICFLLEWLL
jgi:Ca-activated chloride channel homolog